MRIDELVDRDELMKCASERLSMTKAAERLGISRTGLREYCARHGINYPRKYNGSSKTETGWELDISVRQWGRIIAYANRESPEAAAEVYGVPLGAVEAAISGDEWSLD